MGNSALACIRGNVNRQVRVILSDGNVVEFKKPVTASTVMRRFPQHLVLHCSMARLTGQRRKISVVKAEEILSGRQDYLVMPVQSVSNAKTFIEVWAFYALTASNMKRNTRLKSQQKPRYSPNKRRWIHDILAKMFRVSQVCLESDEESAKSLLAKQPSVQSRQVEVTASCLENWKFSLACMPESGYFANWKPSLACIPESPDC